jgi:branched-chain amino acid transport system permease protein
MLIYALLAASLDLLVGITGLPSLGHAAYFGVGAYAGGWIAANATPAAPAPLLAAAAAGALAAAATGWVAVRSAGIFFLILTLAIAEIIEQLAESWEPVTGGSNGMYGIPAARVAGEPLTQVAYLHRYVLAWFGVGLLVLWSLSASPFGATLRGIRDNEPRMRAPTPSGTSWRRSWQPAPWRAWPEGCSPHNSDWSRRPTSASPRRRWRCSRWSSVAPERSGCPPRRRPSRARPRHARPTLGGHGPLVLGLVFITVVHALPRGFAGLRSPHRRHRPGRPVRGTK